MADNKKKLSRKRELGNVLWVIRAVWRHTPSYAILAAVEGLAWGINNSVGILFTKLLFDMLGNGTEFGSIMKLIVSYSIYLAAFYVFHVLYWYIFNPKIRTKLQYLLMSEMFGQAVRIDLEKYDDPDFYNGFIWAMDASIGHVSGIVEASGKIINRVVASFTLTGILMSVDPIMAFAVLAVSVIRMFLTSKRNKVNYAKKEEMNPLNKKDGYIARVFKLPDYAKDLRISHVRDNLFDELDKNTDEKVRVIKKYGNKSAWLWSVISSINEATTIGLLVFMLYKVMVTKTVELGGFAVAVNAVWKMSWLMSDFVVQITKVHEDALYIEKMRTFMECEPEILDGESEADSFEELEIKDLSFSYVKTDKYALKNVNMKIRKGEKIAIVGYNGAGKTTLTKLIMRFYDAKEGEILYNGKSLKEYTVESLRKNTAAVFQDYRIFAASIAENVVGGEFDAAEESAVLTALGKSTFSDKLEKLEGGIDTHLTREFDNSGTQLSGGEAQKVAIARAFYKDAGLIILDEPSSALDPNAEYELNRAIAEYAQGRAVIFISHRLSTTRHADRIYMFDSGELVECGTHEELMALGGKYAYMFDLQAQNYR